MQRFLACFLALATLTAPLRAAEIAYPPVVPGAALAFPRDHGAHPDFRTEWWYVTGWLKTAEGRDLGFQVTFFRTRPQVDPANPSRFAPRKCSSPMPACPTPRSATFSMANAPRAPASALRRRRKPMPT